MTQPTQQKIPATLFSGFLGSGKTTIISHLIEVLQSRGEQVVYIKNEIGDTDIDSQLLQAQGIKTKELLNGCICCTLVGPFVSAITEIVNTLNPTRIIIEASGTADPSALALMISSHPLLVRDGVVTVIDAVNFTGYADLSITNENQTKFTDLLIFNKVELVDLQQKRAVVGYVRELNTHSPIIEAVGGVVNPEVVFGMSSVHLEELLEKLEDTHHEPPHDHTQVDHIEAFHITLESAVNLEAFTHFLQNLPPTLFRTKGYILTDLNATYLFFNTVA